MIQGLTLPEVSERKARGQVNKSGDIHGKTLRDIFLENLFSVFNLIIAVVIIFLFIFYLRTSDKRLVLDSLGVFSVALINTLLAIFQEIKAKRALDKVNLLLKKEVKVVRGGNTETIDRSEIVLDDIICIERGDQASVDGLVVESNRMEIDESLLTGESLPVIKKENDKILSGSFCVSGTGYYKAEKIGDDSYASQVMRMAKKFKLNVSPLQKKLNLIVKVLFSVSVCLVILELIYRAELTEVDLVRRISTIMLALIPQGLILTASITFELGIYRISKIGAIVQKLNAIESFSNVKVVCTDKTGTLTQNKLSIRDLNILNDKFSPDEVKKLLGTYAKLSSDKNATLRTLEMYPADEMSQLKDEIPFSSEKKISMIEVRKNDDKDNEIFVLGGYDILIDKIENNFKDKANKVCAEKELKVYRNLLFGILSKNASLEDINDGKDYSIEPLCIVSIADTVRTDVMEAIKLFRDNNIEIKILSGDAAPAVQAIAKEIGWNIKDTELITGKELEEITEENLSQTIMSKSIFARLKPDHKLRIIKSLRKDKIYTAMIGDGVNDLPAIKESDMGIAMEEGSSITKEVADIVLLKNKFSLLPGIFNEGNKIVNTVNSVAKLFLTKSFLVIYLILLSLFFMLHFPLTPRRVALINLLSIAIPSFVIALRNRNISKMTNFMPELISYVSISALFIAGSAFLAQYLMQKYYSINESDLQVAMLAVMIFTTISNFLMVAINKYDSSRFVYFIYALLIIIVFALLAIWRVDFIILNLLRDFYEVYQLKVEYWLPVIIISIVCSVLLLFTQKMREKIVNKLLRLT